jgi:hypothetical protein
MFTRRSFLWPSAAALAAIRPPRLSARDAPQLHN